MKQRKAPVGAIEVTMASEEFNTLLAVLDEIIVCGADTKLGFFAKRLKEKMLRYSRRFIHRNTRKSVTYFFENEAALLIKLLAFYCNAVGIIGENYYDQIGKEIATNGKEEI